MTTASTPFPLVSRDARPEGTVVRFDNGVQVGGGHIAFIAGPCSLEPDETRLHRIAEVVQASGCQFLRGGAYKPRTSPYDFQGIAEVGLAQLVRAREKTGLLIVTEVMDTQDVDAVAKAADVVQVGTRNMQNFALLKAVGQQPKPVLLKRGMAATVKEFLLAAEYIVHHGNPNVMLCERGIRSFDSAYTRNVLDLAMVPVLKRLSHLPVVVDPSHATGHRYLIAPMVNAALIAGADGVMCEVHDEPDQALSDGPQSLDLAEFQAMMAQVPAVVALAKTLQNPAGHDNA